MPESVMEWHDHRGETGVRRYALYIPPDLPTDASPALVVMLHGCTQDPEDFALGTGMNHLADELGFLVLYPEQPVEAHDQKCWRWFERAHQRAGAGEAGILSDMIRTVRDDRGVPRDQVFVAGISAGGAMTLILVATEPELFSAAAVHSAVPYGAAADESEALAAMEGEGPPTAELTRRLRNAGEGNAGPLLVIHGEADPAVSARNGQRIAHSWVLAYGSSGTDEPPSPTRAELVEVPERYPATRTAWEDDAFGAVELVRIQELGHAWSGGHPPGTFVDPRGPDASSRVLEFFRARGGLRPLHEEQVHP